MLQVCGLVIPKLHDTVTVIGCHNVLLTVLGVGEMSDQISINTSGHCASNGHKHIVCGCGCICCLHLCHICICAQITCLPQPSLMNGPLTVQTCQMTQQNEELYPRPISTAILQVDPAEWRLEVERVAPRLKITVASNARDWRSHLDEAHKHSQEISTVWPDAQAALGAVQTEVSITDLAACAPCSLVTLVNQMTARVLPIRARKNRLQFAYSNDPAAA